MYLPAHNETVFLVPRDGYNYLAKIPLKVIDVRNTRVTVECLEHPAFTNGVRHHKNDMAGFQFTVTTDNLVPADLLDAALFYSKHKHLDSPFTGNITFSTERKAEILKQYSELIKDTTV